MKLSIVIKASLGVLATILLGAIGSGVWEKIPSPLLAWISEFITDTVSSISTGYSNSIYIRATRLPHTGSTAALGLVLFLLVLLGLFVVALKSKKDNRLASILYDSIIRTHSGWRGMIFSCAFIVVTLFLMAKETAVIEVSRYAVTQMEIVRPYIGENKYRKLYSDYLLINSEGDFKKFLSNLYQLAEQHHMEIEKFRESEKGV